MKLKILTERCKGCGLCIEVCPKKILEMSKETNSNSYYYASVKDESLCVGCGNCYVVCPDYIIEVRRD